MTDVAERLLARSVRADDGSGCLRWTGAHLRSGYGNIRVGPVTRLTHVVAYELWVGPIPDGHELDHVKSRGCRHKDCLSLAHLEPVVHAENMRRARRTHCRRNHPLTGDNVKLSTRSNGWMHRECRTCANATDRATYRRRGRNARTLSENDPQHGTRSGYANFGCRCDPCKEGSRAYLMARTARKRQEAAR